jgi:plastocyanin
MLSSKLQSLLIVVAAVAATGLWPEVAAAAAYSKSPMRSVIIAAMRFQPQKLTVKVGDTIVWSNHDPFPHTVTATGRQFDSHAIAAGTSWKYTARHTGVFTYTCSLHSTMSATLRVK